MKFFVPSASAPADETRILSAIKSFLSSEIGAQFSDRRIQHLRWAHDNQKHHATVGELTSLNGEQVVAILYDASRDLYHVCTPNRGVFRGMSILASAHAVQAVVDFDPDDDG